VIGGSPDECGSRQSVPTFVWKMIEQGQSEDSQGMVSFVDTFNTLKTEHFRILE
jgi:DNA helicase TIP49 (TBP-interacting protein)